MQAQSKYLLVYADLGLNFVKKVLQDSYCKVHVGIILKWTIKFCQSNEIGLKICLVCMDKRKWNDAKANFMHI